MQSTVNAQNDTAVVAQPTAKKSMMTTAQAPVTEGQKQEPKSSWNPLRMRGGIGPCCAIIDGCLCCCALEDLCCCGLEELC